MKEAFGCLPSGEAASLYTVSLGAMRMSVTDYGASLVRLLVPDAAGNVSDVVLGYDDVSGYVRGTGYLGATVGRNANRIAGGSFSLDGTPVTLPKNENGNNLHSGPDSYARRLWTLEREGEHSLTFRLDSPHGDQGFPGNAVVHVTYVLEAPGTLRIQYDAVSDRDTVFNLTNHTYFNLAGHDKGDRAMDQILMLPARFFHPADAESIPTGEERPVAGTPMDFREPKALGRDIGADYEPLRLQGGYDHDFEVFCDPCAVLTDPSSGRSMAVSTDCPGLQVYSANFLDDTGKGGARYAPRCGVALETQFYPDAVHHPDWPQPVVRAGRNWRSVTRYRFF